MGGAIDWISDTSAEIITLGAAETKTYNATEIEEKRKIKEAGMEQEAIMRSEQEKEDIFSTELEERMATGGYRSLIGGAEVVDTTRGQKAITKEEAYEDIGTEDRESLLRSLS